MEADRSPGCDVLGDGDLFACAPREVVERGTVHDSLRLILEVVDVVHGRCLVPWVGPTLSPRRSAGDGYETRGSEPQTERLQFAHGTVLLGGLQALGFEGSIEARVDASGVQLEYLALVGLG